MARKPIKVLHFVMRLHDGGIDQLLYNYYQSINHDLIHFDFAIIDSFEPGRLESLLERMNCKIYRIPAVGHDPICYINSVRKIIRENKYDVIHSHGGANALFAMIAGKLEHVPVRIAHSHIAKNNIKFFQKLDLKVKSFLTRSFATHLFGCGQLAAQYAWGLHRKTVIMPNAISTKNFSFSQEKRNTLRNSFNFNNDFIIGIVARMEPQKNFMFLLEVFAAINKNHSNTRLVVVGDGALRKQLELQVEKLKIKDSVIFLGIRQDVGDILNIFDLFVLPSLFEGLPVALVEAQANGLHSFVSNKVTKEMDVSDLIEFLPLETNIWITKISEYITKSRKENRKKYEDILFKTQYEISNAAEQMTIWYQKEVEKNKRL